MLRPKIETRGIGERKDCLVLKSRSQDLTPIWPCPKPLSSQEIATYCNLKNIYPYLKKLRTSHSIKETENGDLELHSHLLKTAILLKILPIIDTEPYLSNLMEIFYTDDMK